MSNETPSHLSNRETWKRGLFILLFALLYGVAEVVLWAVILFQFGSRLISGHCSDSLLEFSKGLNAYFYQILQYLSFRSDYKPYPFNDWPAAGLTGEVLEPVGGATEEPSPAAVEEEEGPAKPEG